MVTHGSKVAGVAYRNIAARPRRSSRGSALVEFLDSSTFSLLLYGLDFASNSFMGKKNPCEDVATDSRAPMNELYLTQQRLKYVVHVTSAISGRLSGREQPTNLSLRPRQSMSDIRHSCRSLLLVLMVILYRADTCPEIRPTLAASGYGIVSSPKDLLLTAAY